MLKGKTPDIQIPSVPLAACPRCGRLSNCSRRQAFSLAQCTYCGATLTVPGKLDSFVLLGVLGQGRMVVTYRGYDDLLGRQVAVKVLRPALADHKPSLDAFGAETRALGSLNHPNLLKVYSLGMGKRPPYVVMELMPSRHWGLMFGPDRPMDEAAALDTAIDAAAALEAAWSAGLFHGNLKPEKVRLDGKGTVKLVDFGTTAPGAQQEGIVATPYYASPEQVARQPTNHRSDIYGLGAVLFHALTGRPPFTGKTVRGVLRARLRHPAPDPRAIRPSLHRRTAEVVAKMLATDPAQRHKAYPALLSELREARDAAAQTGRPRRDPDTSGVPAPQAFGEPPAGGAGAPVPQLAVSGRQADVAGEPHPPAIVAPIADTASAPPASRSRLGRAAGIAAGLLAVVGVALVAVPYLTPAVGSPTPEAGGSEDPTPRQQKPPATQPAPASTRTPKALPQPASAKPRAAPSPRRARPRGQRR